MKIIIQCAGSKQKEAPCFQTEKGKNVLFVAQPELTGQSLSYEYCSPDEVNSKNTTWRQELVEYNKTGRNEQNLLPAYQLYSNDIYRKLVYQFGAENVFILSAGWGLINSVFLTPNYNITWASKDKYSRRTDAIKFYDINMLPLDCTDDLIFFGGIKYLKLFDKLTKNYSGRRIVFYNSKNLPDIERCILRKFETKQKTNWHYTCARQYIEGKLLR